MYAYAMYTLVFVILCGLDAVSCGMISNKHPPPHVNTRSVTPATGVQDEGDLSQLPENRCGAVALRCYEPILSYMDGDGEICGWKDMNTFNALPDVCSLISQFSMSKWAENVIKYNYKFLKTCDKTKEFQKCVINNEVCSRDKVMSIVISGQNTFCNDIQAVLSVTTCKNAWDRSVNWNKLVYTDWRIVQACPATHYRQLALNSIKLFIFSYITSPSSWTDGVVKSVNAEAAGRLICQYMQQDLCFDKRGDAVCPGYLPLVASLQYNDKQLNNFCRKLATANNYGKCNAFVKGTCLLNITTGHMLVNMNFPDITNVYNMTYWHSVGSSEVEILLHTHNKGIGHCDVSNLIFKQLGCFHQYMTQMDMNHANHGSYLSEYMCSNIKVYNSCFEAYIQSSCPDEAEQFQGIGNLLHSQCDILKEANKNVTCPLFSVYSKLLFGDQTWFALKKDLIQQYITVIKCQQMDAAPSGWRVVLLNNFDRLIMYYKSVLIKGENSMTAAFYNNDLISTVCDQETADMYNDYVNLSTGEQYYQFVNHVIKGLEYIKYIIQ